MLFLFARTYSRYFCPGLQRLRNDRTTIAVRSAKTTVCIPSGRALLLGGIDST